VRIRLVRHGRHVPGHRVAFPGAGKRVRRSGDCTLCATLDDLEDPLRTVSEEGVAQGDEIVSDLDAFARALETAAAVLETANANDAAATASSLASDLEAITTDAGEAARERAGDAADKLDELSTEIDCSGSST
jgi:hypothetical protein